MYLMLRSKIFEDKIPNITNVDTNTTLTLKTKYLVLLT